MELLQSLRPNGACRCIACDESGEASNPGVCESCLGRCCLLRHNHPYIVMLYDVSIARSHGAFIKARRERVGLYVPGRITLP